MIEDEPECEEIAGVQFDRYGVKTKVRPGDSNPAPSSWSEVALRINKAAMRVAAGLMELPAEAIDGTMRLWRGLTSMPVAIAQRVAGAHATADKEERRRQLLAESANEQITAEEAESRLKAILLRYQREGYHAELAQQGGRFTVIVVRPDLAGKAHAIAARDGVPVEPPHLLPDSGNDDAST